MIYLTKCFICYIFFYKKFVDFKLNILKIFRNKFSAFLVVVFPFSSLGFCQVFLLPQKEVNANLIEDGWGGREERISTNNFEVYNFWTSYISCWNKSTKRIHSSKFQILIFETLKIWIFELTQNKQILLFWCWKNYLVCYINNIREFALMLVLLTRLFHQRSKRCTEKYGSNKFTFRWGYPGLCHYMPQPVKQPHLEDKLGLW